MKVLLAIMVASVAFGERVKLYTPIPSDPVFNTITSTGKATVGSIEYTATNIYEDLRFPFSAIDLPGIGSPPAVAIVSNCIYTLTFTQNEYLFFSPQMSHQYWENTPLLPHLHSISSGTPVTNTYALIYSYADTGEVYTAPQTNTVTIGTSGVAGEHGLHDLGTIDGLSPGVDGGVSAMIGIKLVRTDSGASINLTELDIHYRIKYGGGKPYTP